MAPFSARRKSKKEHLKKENLARLIISPICHAPTVPPPCITTGCIFSTEVTRTGPFFGRFHSPQIPSLSLGLSVCRRVASSGDSRRGCRARPPLGRCNRRGNTTSLTHTQVAHKSHAEASFPSIRHNPPVVCFFPLITRAIYEAMCCPSN